MRERPFMLPEGGYVHLHMNHYQGQTDLSASLRASLKQFYRPCSPYSMCLLARLQLAVLTACSLSHSVRKLVPSKGQQILLGLNWFRLSSPFLKIKKYRAYLNSTQSRRFASFAIKDSKSLIRVKWLFFWKRALYSMLSVNWILDFSSPFLYCVSDICYESKDRYYIL